MGQEYDVIIIGAGPAGLSCAIELQQSNKSVLVLDKNRIIGPKVCAGGLTAKVENLGFPFSEADKVFSSVKLNVCGKTKVLTEKKPIVATIDREKLGKILLGKVSTKVEVRSGSLVTQINDEFITVDGKEIRYKYLVGADGASSSVRKYLGLRTGKILTTLQYTLHKELSELEVFMDARVFGWGYAWIFPHKGYTFIGCGRDARYLKNINLKNNFDNWLRSKNIDVKGAELHGGVINFDYQGFEFGNKFLVGDAAGFSSGLTGEGIYYAIISGMEVARKIINPSYKPSEIVRILNNKRLQELPLKMFSVLSDSMIDLSFKLFSFLLTFKYFKEKALKLYS